MNVINQMEDVILMQFVKTLLDQEHVHVRMDTLEMEFHVQVSKIKVHYCYHIDMDVKIRVYNQ